MAKEIIAVLKRIAALAVLSLMAASCQSLVPALPQRSLSGGTRIWLRAQTDGSRPGAEWNQDMAKGTAVILEKRLRAMGVAGRVRTAGRSEFVVELPRLKGREGIIEGLKTTCRLEFRHLRNVHYASAPRWRPAAGKYTLEISQDAKGGDVYTFTASESGKVVPAEKILSESRLILTGEDLKPDSRATKDPQTYRALVAIEFTGEGKKTFADFTRRNVGEVLAVVLDGRILSAPTIREAILAGRAQIEGTFTLEDASRLAQYLNAGALPAPLKVVRTEKIP